MAAPDKTSSSVDEKDDLPPPAHQVSVAPTFGSRQDPDERPQIHLKTWLAVLAASLTYAAQLYSLVSTAVALRSVEATFNGQTIGIWANQVFGIVTTVVGPPLALATDETGRRYPLLAVCCLVLAGALISSESTSMGMFIGGRVLAAFSAAATPLVTSIPSEVLPHAWRPNAQAILNFIGSMGGVVGALLAGYFSANVNPSEMDGWRYTFRVEAILTGISLLGLVVFYRPPPRPYDRDLTLFQKLAKVDLISTVLLAGFIIPFVLALTWGGVTYAWSDGRVVAPLVVGLAMFVILVVYSVLRPNGLFNHQLFSRSRNYGLALLCQAIEGCIFLGYLSFYPAVAALVWGSSGTLIGLRVALPFVGGVAMSPIVGYISTKYKLIRYPIMGGFLGYTVAMIGLATCYHTYNSGVGWFWAMLVGLSVAPLLLNLVVTAQLAAPAHLIGLSTGVLLAVRTLLGVVIVAVITAITNSKAADYIGSYLPATIIQLGVNPATPTFGQTVGEIIGATTSFNADALAPILIQAGVAPQAVGGAIGALFGSLADAFAETYKYAWIVMAPIAFCGIIVAAFLDDRKQDLNQLVDAPVEEIHHDHSGSKA